MKIYLGIALAVAFAAVPVVAQLSVPPIAGVLPGVTRRVGGALDSVDGAVEATAAQARALARTRVRSIAALVRANPMALELDDDGRLARRGEVIIVDADIAAIAAAQRAGFRVIEQTSIAELDMALTRLAVPGDEQLGRAVRRLRRLLPAHEVTSDQLLLQSGATTPMALQAQPPAPPRVGGVTVGLVDGGVARHIPVAVARGFANGAPVASAHGSAVASLLRRGGATRIIAADVFGTEPAGGSSSAVARALAWLVQQRVPVISISLVGPDNILLRRAIAGATARGIVVVAAVGNDGPAAPPSYPASYPSVVAVTGVDRRNRALIEAGRALHLDYAAPGADISASGADGSLRPVRGTSFATPLVAARLAVLMAAGAGRSSTMAMLDREAVDLGRRGADPLFGRGLICGECRAAQ
ncbi:MAG: S8 family serine peptidase [Sphingopyxis sp.]